MWWVMALSLVTGLPPPPPPQAGFMDAARLNALCEATGPDAQSARSLCLGYVVGAVDQLLASQARRGRATVCPPADLTVNDALNAVMRRSRYASTAAGVTAAGFVRFAMEDSYPCPTPLGRR
jgi:hypothetical protein